MKYIWQRPISTFILKSTSNTTKFSKSQPEASTYNFTSNYTQRLRLRLQLQKISIPRKDSRFRLLWSWIRPCWSEKTRLYEMKRKRDAKNGCKKRIIMIFKLNSEPEPESEPEIGIDHNKNCRTRWIWIILVRRQKKKYVEVSSLDDGP